MLACLQYNLQNLQNDLSTLMKISKWIVLVFIIIYLNLNNINKYIILLLLFYILLFILIIIFFLTFSE